MRVYPYLTFYLPGYYTMRTRHSTLKDVVRFALTYFIPIFFFLIWREYSLANLLIGFLLVYDLYEVGYIENDCETVKKESTPTLRLETVEYSFYEHHKWSIYIGKIVFAVFVVIILNIRDVGSIFAFFPFLLVPSYMLYNSMRSRWNLVLHAWLMFIRYYVPILIAVGIFMWKDAVAFLFVYPVRVMIELSVKGKFGGYQNRFVKKYILSDYSNFQSYRLNYYMVTTVFVCILYTIEIIDLPIVVLYVYYLLFTFSSKTVGV